MFIISLWKSQYFAFRNFSRLESLPEFVLGFEKIIWYDDDDSLKWLGFDMTCNSMKSVRILSIRIRQKKHDKKVL